RLQRQRKRRHRVTQPCSYSWLQEYLKQVELCRQAIFYRVAYEQQYCDFIDLCWVSFENGARLTILEADEIAHVRDALQDFPLWSRTIWFRLNGNVERRSFEFDDHTPSIVLKHLIRKYRMLTDEQYDYSEPDCRRALHKPVAASKTPAQCRP